MVGYPSGQRGQTVNLLAMPSMVRIHHLPPLFFCNGKVDFNQHFQLFLQFSVFDFVRLCAFSISCVPVPFVTDKAIIKQSSFGSRLNTEVNAAQKSPCLLAARTFANVTASDKKAMTTQMTRHNREQQNIETKDFTWLVHSRSKIQKELLALYNFLRKNRLKLETQSSEALVYLLLVGAGFSLWRAAFLADARRSKSEVLQNVEEFLEYLVRDNAIGYPQDQKTRKWTVGYYLGDARYRLQRVNDLLSTLNTAHARTPVVALAKLDQLYNERGELSDTIGVWDAEYESLLELFKRLRSAKVFKRRRSH
jgi:hypothetical protein